MSFTGHHAEQLLVGQRSNEQSISFVYQVTPARTGEFTIPAIPVNVGGNSYSTEPIRLVVEKDAAQDDTSQQIFAHVHVPSKQCIWARPNRYKWLLFRGPTCRFGAWAGLTTTRMGWDSSSCRI